MPDTGDLILEVDFLAETYKAADRAAISKVEDAFKALIETGTVAGGPLEGWTVIVDQSADIKIEPDDWPVILIYTTGLSHQQFEEQSMHLHIATVEFEFISTATSHGPISRRNLEAIAQMHRIIAADRYLGGRLQICEEVDTAPAVPNGKDVGSASIQYEVQFFTRRDNWFTILGSNAEF